MFWTVTQALMSGLWTTFEMFYTDTYIFTATGAYICIWAFEQV